MSKKIFIGKHNNGEWISVMSSVTDFGKDVDDPDDDDNDVDVTDDDDDNESAARRNSW